MTSPMMILLLLLLLSSTIEQGRGTLLEIQVQGPERIEIIALDSQKAKIRIFAFALAFFL
jgi:hypothetical protein